MAKNKEFDFDEWEEKLASAYQYGNFKDMLEAFQLAVEEEYAKTCNPTKKKTITLAAAARAVRREIECARELEDKERASIGYGAALNIAIHLSEEFKLSGGPEWKFLSDCGVRISHAPNCGCKK